MAMISISSEPGSAGSARRCSAWLAVILLLALAARGGVLIWAEQRPERFDFPDSRRYLLVARNLDAGHGPIESPDVRSGTDPLYPAVLAAGLRLGLAKDDADGAALMRFGRVVNALFGVISVALLAALTRRLFGAWPALVAAAILAVDPILLYFNALVLTETCHVALLLAAFYCLTRTAGREAAVWAAAAGGLLGLAALARSSSLLLPLALLPFAAAGVGAVACRSEAGPSRQLPAAPPRAAVVIFLLLGTAAPLLPIVLRNYALFDRFVPVRTGSGASLMEALGPWADGGPGMDRIVYPPMPDGADEIERDHVCRTAALDWARSHPIETLRLAWVKFLRTWSITVNAPGYSSPLYTAVGWMTVAPLYILAAMGARRLWQRRATPPIRAATVRERSAHDPEGRDGPLVGEMPTSTPTPAALSDRALLAWLLVVPAYFTLLHMVFVGSVRYRVPAMPFLFVLAALGLEGLLRWLVTRRLAAVNGATL